jgi:hypothetical protein
MYLLRDTIDEVIKALNGSYLDTLNGKEMLQKWGNEESHNRYKG